MSTEDDSYIDKIISELYQIFDTAISISLSSIETGYGGYRIECTQPSGVTKRDITATNRILMNNCVGGLYRWSCRYISIYVTTDPKMVPLIQERWGRKLPEPKDVNFNYIHYTGIPNQTRDTLSQL